MSGKWQAGYAERYCSRALSDNAVSSSTESRGQPAINSAPRFGCPERPDRGAHHF